MAQGYLKSYLAPVILSIRYIMMVAVSVFCTAGVYFSEGGENGMSQNAGLPTAEELHIERFANYYDKVFAKGFKASGCPGAIVTIVQDTNVVYMRGFGVNKAGTKDSVSTSSLFRIGSLSKGFTGVLCGILVEQGIIHWEDKVMDIIPEFRLKDMEQAKRITIAHLLSHSVGLPRHTFTDLVEDGMTITEIMDRLDEVNLLGEEGKFFAYQNHAYSIIEEILWRKTGTTFQDLLSQYLLKPAGMQHVSTDMSSFMACDDKTCPHRGGKKGYTAVPWNGKYYNAASCGGINATGNDMAEWLKVLLGHRENVIGDSALMQVFTPYIDIKDNDYYHNWYGVQSVGYAMGWRVLECGDHQIEYHAGSVNDYRSEIAIDHQNNIAICVLFNAQNSYARNVVRDFLLTYKVYEKVVNQM